MKCAKKTVYIREYVKKNHTFGHNINEEEDGSVVLVLSYPHFLQ